MKIAASLLSLGFILVVLELACRFLPVNHGRVVPDINSDSPIVRFEPNATTHYSLGPFLKYSNKVKINNYGFVSNIDYNPDDPKPKIAIIGDSYIEALTVPWTETLQGRLNDEIDSHLFYSFGISGSPLSQYLAFARFAKEEFAPKSYVFLIIGNDFDESFYKYRPAPAFHYFTDPFDPQNPLELISYSPSFIKRIERRSRFGSYLRRNIKIQHRINVSAFPDEPKIPYTDLDKKISISNKATDHFIELLPKMTGKEAASIYFIIDGLRSTIYDPSSDQSYFESVRGYFIEKALSAGYNVIDLQPAFEQHFSRHRQLFNFEDDYHWNSLGHQIAAEEIGKTLDLSSK